MSKYEIVLTEDQVSKMKMRMLDTFKYFDCFCKENGLTYYACAGTAIGALRHSGFIPWDDDIDVYMLRKDYDRLKELRCSKPMDHLLFVYPGDDGYWLPYAKVCSPDSTFVSELDWTRTLGFSIDIFPEDAISDDFEQARKDVLKYKKLWARYQYCMKDYSFKRLMSVLGEGRIKSFVKDVYGALIFATFLRRKAKKDFFAFEEQIKKKEGTMVTCYGGYWRLEREAYRKEWFDGIVLKPFEDMEIPLPVGYDGMLKTLYGDYMTPPPVEKRASTHRCVFISFEKHFSNVEVKRFVWSK